LPLVGVVMGSASDEAVVQETVNTLEQLGVDYEVRVMSAHRTPERVQEYATTARDRASVKVNNTPFLKLSSSVTY